VEEEADQGDIEPHLLLIERRVLRSLPDHRNAIGRELHPRYLVRIERGFEIVGVQIQHLTEFLLFLDRRCDEDEGVGIRRGDDASLFEFKTQFHLSSPAVVQCDVYFEAVRFISLLELIPYQFPFTDGVDASLDAMLFLCSISG
jgi:hypothetical protein